MDRDWDKLEAIYHEAAALPETARSSFLDGACGADAELRSEVEQLLAHAGTSLLDGPIRIGDPRASIRPTLTRGTRLGPYEIEAHLGGGGMGDVYRARDTRLRRTVAIKVVADVATAGSDARERFRREAMSVAALAHPHICTVHDVGHDRGIDYIVMEYLDGETLAQRIARGPLAVRDVLTIGAAIADALGAAHRLGVVHRDVKPANIVLTANGAKLLDFGIARRISGSMSAAQTGTGGGPSLTAPGLIVGTPAYMAPEQLTGRPVDHRADLWAFGCVLYEMVTGTSPFAAGTAAESIAAILERDPPPLQAARIPPRLNSLLARLLVRDVDERWDSARDARFELEWLIREGNAAAEENRPTHRAHRLAVIAGFVALAIAFAGAASRLFSSRKASAPLLTLSLLPPDGTRFDTAAVSPDGRLVAFTGVTSEGTRHLWIRALDSAEARLIRDSESAEFPFWSPDSQQIGYFARGRLLKVAVTGGPPQTITDHLYTRGATWGASGVILFTPASAAPLFRIEPAAGRVTQATVLDSSRQETSHRWPVFLPDGRHYLFTIRSALPDVHGIYLGDLQSTTRTRLVSDVSNAAYVSDASRTDYLVFPRGSTLMAQRLDLARQSTVGEPKPVVSNVWYSRGWSHSSYSLSRTGVVAFESSPWIRDLHLTWFDRAGVRQGAVGGVGAFAPAKVTLSPDGNALALETLDPDSGTSRLWTVDLDRGISSPFTPVDHGPELTPVWTPDGQRIIFADRSGIVIRGARAGGSDERLLRLDGETFVRDCSLDGRFVLYERREATGETLWAAPLVGPVRTPFKLVRARIKPGATESVADEINGAFSPDGQWIAYDSDESGRREVYVQRFERAPAPERWQISSAGGLYPQWRRDGRELFFLSADLVWLMRVEVSRDSAGSIRFSAPTPLFKVAFHAGITPSFAVSTDGQRFLIAAPSTNAGNAATIMLNWIDTVLR